MWDPVRHPGRNVMAVFFVTQRSETGGPISGGVNIGRATTRPIIVACRQVALPLGLLSWRVYEHHHCLQYM
jgi:hypothetical protein